METMDGTVPMMATCAITSVGRRWRTHAEMHADLRRPGFKDIAPMFQLQYQGEGADGMAERLWNAPRRSPEPLPARARPGHGTFMLYGN